MQVFQCVSLVLLIFLPSIVVAQNCAIAGCTTCQSPSVFFDQVVFPNQTGTFELSFSVFVINQQTTWYGFGAGTITTFANYAGYVKFEFPNVIVRNGNNFGATNPFTYKVNTQYNVRAVVNVAKKTYSAFIAKDGNAETQIANNFAFRTEQAKLAVVNVFSTYSLANMGGGQVYCLGTVTVKVNGNVVFPVAPPPPPSSDPMVPLNANCALIVPQNPLTATGLATPYQLTALNAADGPCNIKNPQQATFVQAAVINTDTSQISLYNPLVIDKGTTPLVAPVRPTLPTNNIVAIWFGTNADTLTLLADGNSLTQGACVNGITGSIFGQFAYCNAPAFFTAANNGIKAGKLIVPPLGVGLDGQPCPSVRDFSVVDQDQSDNVLTKYLIVGNTAVQDTAANRKKFPNATESINGSDNVLLAVFLAGALGCNPWKAPDLADNNSLKPSLPLDELQAMVWQQPPVALIPAGDPMCLDNNGNLNLQKLNAYRVGVNIPTVVSFADADTTLYCKNMAKIAPIRFLLDSPLTIGFASPAPDDADNLFTFLAMRFVNSWAVDNLNCQALIGNSPIGLGFDLDGVVQTATVDTTANSASRFSVGAAVAVALLVTLAL